MPLTLEQSVARATGESRDRIDRIGFMLDSPTHRPNPDLLVLDCPFCGNAVILATSPRDLPTHAECPCCDTAFDYSDQEIYRASLDDLPVRRAFRPLAA